MPSQLQPVGQPPRPEPEPKPEPNPEPKPEPNPDPSPPPHAAHDTASYGGVHCMRPVQSRQLSCVFWSLQSSALEPEPEPDPEPVLPQSFGHVWAVSPLDVSH